MLVAVLLGGATVLPVQAKAAAVICLDAGHGGEDPGAIFQFANGAVLKEADINLDIALALKSLLEESGQRVVMTRTDDKALTTKERYPVANNAEATVLVSIHTNSITPDVADGIDGSCTLYFKDADLALAETLESTLYSTLLANAPDKSVFLDRAQMRFFSRMMRRTTMPAVIVEPVFLSQPGEAAQLADAIQRDSQGHVLNNTRRAEIAYALYNGIESYLGSQAQQANDVAPEAPRIYSDVGASLPGKSLLDWTFRTR